MKIAIIDQGTNSSKLSIFDVTSDMPILLKKEKAETRLGDNVENTGLVSDDAVERTITSLNSFKDIANDFGVDDIKVVSTEIMRLAKNKDEVLNRIKNATGLDVAVLSHEDESKIFWHGATNDFTWDGQLAAIDIGGGSVQFMWGRKGILEGNKLLKTGALVLRNRFIKSEPPKDEDYKEIENFIKEEISDLPELGNSTLLIHGSTSVLDFYNEAKMPMGDFAYSNLHPKKANLEDIRNFYLTTRECSKEERSRFYPSHPDFMDGVYIGLTNLLLIADKTGIKEELPSNVNIMNGMILLMKNNKFNEFLLN